MTKQVQKLKLRISICTLSSCYVKRGCVPSHIARGILVSSWLLVSYLPPIAKGGIYMKLSQFDIISKQLLF
jgi:hypothetical protein